MVPTALLGVARGAILKDIFRAGMPDADGNRRVNDQMLMGIGEQMTTLGWTL